jgi:homospermidine synthase
MALRAQTGARGLLAKKAFLKKSAALVVEVQEKEKKKLHTSATKIQALVRGVFGRRKYKRILPILRKEAQRRGFCVECEESIATRRCSDCKDRYCENCFKILHKKGELILLYSSCRGTVFL